VKVFVTGATGLIGAHTARALMDAGHSLRLLVRNRQVAERYFNKHGYAVDDLVVADMLDTTQVRQAMRGCDAVFHAAAAVDLNPRNADKTLANNLGGIDSIIGTAYELGISKILYVSSMGALFTPNQQVLNEQSPLAGASDPYSKSKELAEVKVRELQLAGAPIVITYPFGVFGPEDPKLSESNAAFCEFINTLVPITSSGLQFIDVRDLAEVHRQLLEKELAPQRHQERYVVAGHFYPWREFAALLRQSTPHRVLAVPVPGLLFRWLGQCFDIARRFVAISFPISKEAMHIVTQCAPSDSSKLLNTLDFTFRPAAQTVNDTSAWLAANKLIK
jgi:dihydroflavonol-4-reductase